MDPEDDVRAFLTGAAGSPQPPMRLEAADVIERGGRVRRLRKRFAVAGTSTATAVVLAVAGFLAGHRAGPPEPVEPAGPGLSTIGTTTPPPSPTSLDVPATSIGPPIGVPDRSRPRDQQTQTVRPLRPSEGPGRTTTASPRLPSSESQPGVPTATR